MNDRLNAEEIFHAARERSDPAERAGSLDRACGSDVSLRAKVEALLKADASAGEFLNEGTQGREPDATIPQAGRGVTSRTPVAPSEQAGKMIGRYKLLQPIGEGGFGSVWMAEQREPVKRRVALKIIKLGMDTRQVIARFEAERQALAMMDHPNIAKVLDAGATETGRPYFVMEYIKGVPILEYCDTEKLDTRARLDLFMKVCHAIQHAHQKGIIHRDIKPSNVLITMHDGVPVPKVIDFGIAKATSAELTTKTLFTEHRQMIGTPAYMSPEQAEMSGLDIDTRSDIYSLGVLLYELLTGTTPFATEDLMSKGFAEIMRIIREVEPHKPSTRLSSLGETGTRTAQQRGTDVKKLSSALRGDLDWIVMKCLEKDRTRRYETANGLAADIKRHLNDEPVTAGAPSTGYRLRKFVKRNRAQVIAGGIVAGALVLGVIGTTGGMIWALSEKNRAEAEKTKAALAAESEAKAKLDADQKRQEAETNLEYARKGNAVLGSVFENLDPKQDYATVAELRNALKANLAKAVQDLEGSAIGDPLVVAEMQMTLGESLMGLGAADQAIPLLIKAREIRQARLGPDHSDTLTSMSNLAMAYWEAGKLDLAVSLSEKTFQLRKAKFGPDDSATLTSMNNLASVYWKTGQLGKSIPLFEELLSRQEATRGPDDLQTIGTLSNLGVSYRDAGRLEQAIPILEQAYQRAKANLGADHPNTLIVMTSLAVAYERAGRLDVAVPLFEETIERAKPRLGVDHPHTLLTMDALAEAYWSTNQTDKSVPLYEEILKRREATLGPDHPLTIQTAANLGANYTRAGRLNEEIALLEETLKLATANLSPEDGLTLLCMGNLAGAYGEAGMLDLAVPLSEETLRLRKAKFGPDDSATLTSMNNLASAYWKTGQLGKSIPLFEEVLESQEAKMGRKHPYTVMTVANLGVNYKDAERIAEAIPLLEEAYRASTQYPQLAWVGASLLDAYTKAADSAKPESIARVVALMQELLAAARATLPKDSPGLAAQLAVFSQTLLGVKAWDEAEPLIREALTIREAKEPDDWRTFNTKSLLGGALMGQKKLAEAEPLLLDGYRGMKEREAAIPPQGKVRIPEALERLVRLYEAKGNEPEAASWRSKLEAAREKKDKPDDNGGGG